VNVDDIDFNKLAEIYTRYKEKCDEDGELAFTHTTHAALPDDAPAEARHRFDESRGVYFTSSLGSMTNTVVQPPASRPIDEAINTALIHVETGLLAAVLYRCGLIPMLPAAENPETLKH